MNFLNPAFRPRQNGTLTLLALLFSFPVQSRDFQMQRELTQGNRMELMRITSEAFPDETYSIGLESDSSGSAVAIYYTDLSPGSNASDRRYSFAALSTPQLLIRVMNKYDLVKIRMKGLSFAVLYRQDVRYEQWKEKKFELDCDSQMRGCHAVDPITNRPVSQAYIVSHYVRFFGFIKKAVGIQEIQVR